MSEIITINNYAEFEQKFDNVMQETAERFVVIGYLLKVARDTDILRESGYSTMGEFARKRYGLTKDIASRYIAINDRYSKNGYSEQLDSRYRNFGYAKLAEMLTLPEAIVEEITPEMTKNDIRAIKEEYREEQSVSDIEVMLEEKDPEVEKITSTLEKVLFEALHENPEMFRALWVAVREKTDMEDLADALAPNGMAMITCRIPGTGRLMLSVKGTDEDLQVINIRSGEKEEYGWEDLRQAAEKIFNNENTWKESYEAAYGAEPPEEKPEVAPAQPKTVVKAKKPEKPKKPAEKKEEPKKPEEEQLEGQMTVEDYPEVLPEEPAKTDIQEEQNEIKDPPVAVQEEPEASEAISVAEKSSEDYVTIREEAQELSQGIGEVFWGWEEHNVIPKDELEVALKNAKELVGMLERLMEITEE